MRARCLSLQRQQSCSPVLQRWEVASPTGAARSGRRCLLTPTAARASQALAQQEVEGRAVEGLGVLVQAGVREVLEDAQLAPGDAALERLGEAGGAD